MRQGCAIAIGVASTVVVVLIPSVVFPMIMILSSHHISPSCELRHLSLAVDASVIYFDIYLVNADTNRGIYFDAINVTFRRGAVSAGVTFHGFYQPIGATNWRGSRLGFSGDLSLSPAGGYTRFRVDLKTAVRFRNFLMEEKGVYALELGADVEVNDEGQLVKRRGEDGVGLSLIHFERKQSQKFK